LTQFKEEKKDKNKSGRHGILVCLTKTKWCVTWLKAL